MCECEKGTSMADCMDLNKTKVNKNGLAVAVRWAVLCGSLRGEHACSGTDKFMFFLGRIADRKEGKGYFPCDKVDADKLRDYAYWKWFDLWNTGDGPGGIPSMNDDLTEITNEIEALKIQWCERKPPTPV